MTSEISAIQRVKELTFQETVLWVFRASPLAPKESSVVLIVSEVEEFHKDNLLKEKSEKNCENLDQSRIKYT